MFIYEVFVESHTFELRHRRQDSPPNTKWVIPSFSRISSLYDRINLIKLQSTEREETLMNEFSRVPKLMHKISQRGQEYGLYPTNYILIRTTSWWVTRKSFEVGKQVLISIRKLEQ